MLLFDLCELSLHAPFRVRINNMNSLAITLFLDENMRAEITTKSFPAIYNVNNARNVDLKFYLNDDTVPFVGYNEQRGMEFKLYYDLPLFTAHRYIKEVIEHEALRHSRADQIIGSDDSYQSGALSN